MTLIIAGHEILHDHYSFTYEDYSESGVSRLEGGLFAVSDSIITANGSHGSTPILSGLRKIHHVPVKLWKPFFVLEDFRDYKETYMESGCFIAFAGSTLTATHALNTIVDHLANLQISYRLSSELDSPGEYIAQIHCKQNLLRDTSYKWSESMFLDRDFQSLLSYSLIAETIEHSINVALKSAKKYRITAEELSLMQTEFVAGIYCPKEHTYHLIEYPMCTRVNEEGVIEVYTVGREVPENEIVVLGMKSRFKASAQQCYNQALSSGNPPGAALFEFLNSAIDQVSQSGSHDIDRPSLYKKFNGGKLEKIDVAF